MKSRSDTTYTLCSFPHCCKHLLQRIEAIERKGESHGEQLDEQAISIRRLYRRFEGFPQTESHDDIEEDMED